MKILILLIGFAAAGTTWAQVRCCTYRVTLRTTYSVFPGEGSTRSEAIEDAKIRCVRSGTISSACESGHVTVTSDCNNYRCTLRTTYSAYTGYGQTRDFAIEDARIKCIKSGTIQSACNSGVINCSNY